MQKIIDAGGMLTLVLNDPREVLRTYHQIGAAERYKLVPAGMVLFHRGGAYSLRQDLALVSTADVPVWWRENQPDFEAMIEATDGEAFELATAQLIRARDQARGEVLEARARQWATHEVLLRYVEALERHAGNSEAQRSWAEWARRHADARITEEFFAMPDVTDQGDLRARMRGIITSSPEYRAPRWFQVAAGPSMGGDTAGTPH